MVNIPNIIQCPDYIGLHPSGNSIQYIKRISKLALVGIRLKNEGSAYPITESQLNNYIKTGRVKKLNY